MGKIAQKLELETVLAAFEDLLRQYLGSGIKRIAIKPTRRGDNMSCEYAYKGEPCLKHSASALIEAYIADEVKGATKNRERQLAQHAARAAASIKGVPCWDIDEELFDVQMDKKVQTTEKLIKEGADPTPPKPKQMPAGLEKELVLLPGTMEDVKKAEPKEPDVIRTTSTPPKRRGRPRKKK